MPIKKIFFIITFFFLSVNKVFASDMFPVLEKLVIGQNIPEDVFSLGKEKKSDTIGHIFLEYESQSSAYPHYVELTQSKEVVYIELKIPKTHLEFYKTILNELGKPESVEEQSPSNVLLAYPSKGLGFITSKGNKNFLIQTKYPVKTVEQLRSSEAKNFKEVSQIDTFPTGIITPKPTEPLIPKDLQIQQNAQKSVVSKSNLFTTAAIIFSLLFLVWAGVGIKLYLKNKKQKQQEKQSLVNFSDNIRLPNQRDKV